LLALFLWLSAAAAPAAGGRAMTIADLITATRVTGQALSPDGKQVAYVVTTTDPASLERVGHLWTVASEGGSSPRQITSGVRGESTPAFSPDGSGLAFIADRDGSPQVHVLTLSSGHTRKVTAVSGGVQGPLSWTPDSRRIAFVADVHPDCADDACNRQRAEAAAKGPRVHHARSLLFRHWNEWRAGIRHHVLVAEVESGATLDLTPGDFDAPPHNDEEGGFAWAPDGRELAFVSSHEDADARAWTTNLDVWTVPASGGPAVRRSTSKGADGEPHYTADGRTLVFRSQARAGFEADRWRIVALDRQSGALRSLFETPDLSADELALGPDGKTVLFTATVAGRVNVYSVPLAGGIPRLLRRGGSFHGLCPAAGFAVVSHSTLTEPPELFRVDLGAGSMVRLTDHNRGWLSQVLMPQPETFTVAAARGTEVMSWVLPPPAFDPRRKYPVVFLIHGGPQLSWTDSWSYRWNPALWAAQGWVVVAPNPRGSTGFGQRFVDEISGDWAGKPMDDLQVVFDAVAARPYVDRSRQAIAGASYGGYAVNWLIGHTDRFSAAVSHDGVWNLEAMAGSTEELWFPEWELGGPVYSAAARAQFARFSPHLFAERIRTPTLVISNDLDYRVPVEQGLALFTTLRRRGVPSELMDFYDQGHWVLAPKSSRYWHEQVFGWLQRWLAAPRSVSDGARAGSGTAAGR
jgi:dipeptidyl aminopeptidase/acylaminoacyl peptidase